MANFKENRIIKEKKEPNYKNTTEIKSNSIRNKGVGVEIKVRENFKKYKGVEVTKGDSK